MKEAKKTKATKQRTQAKLQIYPKMSYEFSLALAGWAAVHFVFKFSRRTAEFTRIALSRRKSIFKCVRVCVCVYDATSKRKIYKWKITKKYFLEFMTLE